MPCNYKLYPAHWKAIREHVLDRAENCCECRGLCGHEHSGGTCEAYNGSLIQREKANPAEWRYGLSLGECSRFSKRIKVVLTLAHTCQDPSCDRLDHLFALCQFCHLHLDQEQHRENAKKTRDAKRSQLRLEVMR